VNQTLRHKVTGKTVVISSVERNEGGDQEFPWRYYVNGNLKLCGILEKEKAEKGRNAVIQNYLRMGYSTGFFWNSV